MMGQNFIPTVEVPLGAKQIETLLIHLLRLPDLFREARQLLRTEHFREYEQHFALLWQTAGALFEEFQEVTEDALLGEIEGQYSADPHAMPEELWRELLGSGVVPGGDVQSLIEHTFSVDPAQLKEAWATSKLKAFLRERDVVDPLRRLFQGAGQAVPKEMSEALNDASRRWERIQSVSRDCAFTPVPDDDSEIEPVVRMFPTHVQFFDHLMGGGQAEEEAYTIVGPTGQGKTLIGTKIISSTAVGFQQQADFHNEPLRHAYFVAFEESAQRIGRRIASNIGKIDKGKLEAMQSPADLSPPGEYNDYEYERWGDAINAGNHPCEQERYRGAKRIINRNITILDFSGKYGTGLGGVEEIAAHLARHNETKPVGLVVIDWLGLCVSRYMAAKRMPTKERYTLLAQFVDEVYRLISQRFACPSWVLHQLSGESLKKSPVFKQSTADSHECKTIHLNAHCAFAFGKQDPVTHVMQLTQDKGRRGGKVDEPVLLRIDGRIADVSWVDDDYQIDYAQRRFVAKKDAAAYHGEVENTDPAQRRAGLRKHVAQSKDIIKGVQ